MDVRGRRIAGKTGEVDHDPQAVRRNIEIDFGETGPGELLAGLSLGPVRGAVNTIGTASAAEVQSPSAAKDAKPNKARRSRGLIHIDPLP